MKSSSLISRKFLNSIRCLGLLRCERGKYNDSLHSNCQVCVFDLCPLSAIFCSSMIMMAGFGLRHDHECSLSANANNAFSLSENLDIHLS
jgi:hypothetical protein